MKTCICSRLKILQDNQVPKATSVKDDLYTLKNGKLLAKSPQRG